MKRIALAVLLLLGMTGLSVGQECFDKAMILSVFANMQPSVAFEDDNTLVLKSAIVPSMLVVEFNDVGCAVSQEEIDDVQFDLRYGTGV